MSPIDRDHVDWDLLADHLGGALAGTPDEARVAHLITTDPGWARAAAQLGDALGRVTTDLGTVPPPPAMPDDVAARLDAVLQPLSPATSTGIAAARPPAPGPGPSGQRPPDHRPAPGPAPGRAVRRRRRTRWGAGLAAVAGVVALAAIGLGPLGLADQVTGAESADSAGAPAEAPAGGSDTDGEAPAEALEAVPDSDGADDSGARPPMVASGQDYQPGAPGLQDPPAARDLTNVAPEVQQERPDQRLPTGAGDTLPDELAPLWARPDPCLRAVRADYQPTPVEIQLVDFASFEGRPALMIWLTAGDRREVLVAGPDCGQPAAGLDERYRAERE